MTQQAPEIDTRLRILNTLLTTPHGQMSQINSVHNQMVQDDPLFYQHLAAWYCKSGAIRDHKEAFITNLCLSSFDGHRTVGLALLSELPTHQVENIVNFIHCKEIKKNKSTQVKGKWVTTTLVDKGLEKNIPRSMITEITNYLREREDNQEWFESNALQARKSLKRLYSLLHIKPSELAQQILFDDKPPEGSKLEVLKQLANSTVPSEQAKIIIENKIPYRVATTVVHQMTPTVMLALLEVMSPQELINSIGMLKNRGVFENPELSGMVSEKLKAAKTTKKNVAGLKALEAVKATGVTGDIAKQLEEVADAQVKARGKIKLSTAIIIDKSGSMAEAIEIGKGVCSTVSAICDNLVVYAVDSMPYKITAKENSVAGWSSSFNGIKAGGWTVISTALRAMIKNNDYVEQILLISDQHEQSPKFSVAFKEYCAHFNIQPRVVFINCGNFDNRIEGDLQKLGVDTESIVVGKGVDYYSLPGVIDLLSKGSRFDLLMEIMQTELPQRKQNRKLETV